MCQSSCHTEFWVITLNYDLTNNQHGHFLTYDLAGFSPIPPNAMYSSQATAVFPWVDRELDGHNFFTVTNILSTILQIVGICHNVVSLVLNTVESSHSHTVHATRYTTHVTWHALGPTNTSTARALRLIFPKILTIWLGWLGERYVPVNHLSSYAYNVHNSVMI